MNAQELFLDNGKSSGTWYCGKCKTVKRTLQEAEECCNPVLCVECGKPVENKYWMICEECRLKKVAEKEAERFEKAKKIPFNEYCGWVTDGDDAFYSEIKEYFDSVDEEDRSNYLWACKAIPFVKVNLEDILIHICENGYEGFDEDCLNGIEVLKNAIDSFEQANSDVVAYEPNYDLAVTIEKEK